MPDWEDYYQILGVDPGADAAEIKRAYLDKAWIFHPDRTQGAPESARRRAEEEMKRLNNAHDVLKDPQKRKEYHEEWLRKGGKSATAGAGYGAPKPKPVVDPEVIRFKDVEPGQIQTSSFIISNEGGPYENIHFDNPAEWGSWVWVASRHPITSEQLPIEVLIEAEGEDWGKSYTEYIRVRLDEEETRVRIELNTRPEPAGAKVGVSGIPKTAPPSAPPPVKTEAGMPSWGKWLLGIVLLVMAIAIGSQFWPSETPQQSRRTSPAVAPSPYVPRQTPTPSPTPIQETGKIAFVSDRNGDTDIFVFDNDTGNEQKVTHSSDDEWDPAWSPDGTRIAFTSNRNDNTDIYVMDANGANVIRLTTNSADDFWPDWSPNGKYITFVSNRDGNDEIYIMNANGSNQINLTNDPTPDNYPAFSPDGTRIAFASKRGDYPYYMYLLIHAMNTDGTQVTRLDDLSLFDTKYLNWSPNGKYIAVTQHWPLSADEVKLFNVNSKYCGGLIEEAFGGSFSADSSQLAVSGLREGNLEILLVDVASGRIVRQLTNNNAADWHPDWVS